MRSSESGSRLFDVYQADNAALLAESLEVIQKTSAAILSALENPTEEEGEEPASELAQAS